MLEKRRYYRLATEQKVRYAIAERQFGFQDTRSINLSGGGLCLPVNERLACGSVLELELSLGEGQKPFPILARITWQNDEPVADDDGRTYYETGVEFLKMNFKDKYSIIHFVHVEQTRFN